MPIVLRNTAAAMLTCLSVIASHAGTLSEGNFVGKVMQSFNGSEVESCGVVIAAIESIQGTPSGKLLMFNGSVAIYGPSTGLVKGRASEIDAKLLATGQADLGKVKPLPTTNIWMKAPNAAVTVPSENTAINKSEDPGYLIYVADASPLMSLLESVLDKRPIQVGMRVKGRKFDQALFGTVQMTDAQVEQLGQCLGEWAAAMTKKYKLK